MHLENTRSTLIIYLNLKK